MSSNIEKKRKEVEKEILESLSKGEELKKKKNLPSPDDAQRFFKNSFNEMTEMQRTVLKSTEKCFKICVNDSNDFSRGSILSLIQSGTKLFQ
jgi:hypothetical protein